MKEEIVTEKINMDVKGINVKIFNLSIEDDIFSFDYEVDEDVNVKEDDVRDSALELLETAIKTHTENSNEK